jgi:hypothetical protein
MSVVVATSELVDGARLLTEAVYMYIREFGQPALLAISSMQNPLALLPLFGQQPGMAFLLCFLLSV